MFSNARHHRLSLIALSAALALLILVACTIVPIVGRSQFRLISNDDLIAAVDREFDRFMAVLEHKKVVLSASDSPQAARTVEMVNRVSERILDASGMKHRYDWQIVVVKAREANAFVMPNGKIVVFTGLLPITKNEAGLAAIIGHEVAHVVAQHRAERVSQALVAELAIQVVNIGLALMNSRYRPIVAASVGLGAHYGILLPFSREHESEADHLGLLFMAKAGYDPSEAGEVWERMEARSGSGPWEFLSTHPSPATRRSQLVSWLPEAKVLYADQDRPLPAHLGELESARRARIQQVAIAPIAPRPSFLPGYWWRVQPSNRQTPITYRYVRNETCSVGVCFVVASETGVTILTEDYAVLEFHPASGGFARMSPAMRLVEWPLRIGQEWSQDIIFEYSDARRARTALKVEVAAYESVTTPAGSFMAFKLITSMDGRKVEEYWYAPEVRNVVRIIQRAGLFQSVTREIVDYQKSDEPVIEAGWAQ